MKLSSVERNKVLRMLERKLEVTLVQNREVVGWFLVDGRKTVRFSIPGEHGGRSELSPGAVAKLYRDSKLSREDFIDLLECPLSKEAYIERLKDQGHV